jgi:hypothetical protein
MKCCREEPDRQADPAILSILARADLILYAAPMAVMLCHL